MKEIRKKLSALLTDAGKSAEYAYSGGDCDITGITDDTRSVSEGCIFICVKGARFDGHTAAAEMLEKGAAAVVCDHDLGLGDRQIVVSDTRKFYGHLTAAWFDHPEKQLTLIGITGTNGKTTLATMVHDILSYTGEKTGLIGTTGALIGNEPVERDDSTPTTPKVYELYKIFRMMADQGCKYCVMEVSSFALEQNRIGPAVYECAVFTNLTRDHLDYHGTMENYYQAKKKLFTDHCKCAFINTEDSYGERLYNEISCPKYSYGLKGDTSIYASYIKYSGGVTKFWFCCPGKSFPFTLRMMGGYNILNATAAIAVCAQLKIPMEKITEAMGCFKGVRGRCEIIPTGKDFFIVCDYAHSPDALENMLPSIKENTEGKLICLFGCGGDRDRTKRPLMAKAAAQFADYLIVTSDNPRNEDPDAIIDEIMTGLEGSDVPCDHITDRKEAIFHAVKIARKGDVIVLAGKGHEDYQVLAGNVHIHFDEREICAQALDLLDKISMTVEEMAQACKGSCANIPDTSIKIAADRIKSDSRKILPGDVFVAYRGEKFDGHNYVKDCTDKGAVVNVTDHEIEGCPCIVTKDTVRAVLDIAGHFRRKFSPVLVGVTGSVGKTTTKEMLAAVLGAKLRVLKTPENFNNDIGTPLTLLGLGPEHQAAVIETGMNHFGEIRYLGEMVRPDIAVISNIGDAHIEHLGSREGILKAKSEIFENLKPEGLAVLNGDDALLNTLDLPFRTVRCGRSEHCAVRVMDMADHGVAGITCTVVSPRDTYHLTIPAPGEHMAYSAAIAVAVGEELGLSTEEITRGAASYEPAGSRMRVLRLRDGRLVLDDCYNANPQSVTAALEILAKTECGRKVAVLGDMGELGDLTDQAHYNMGALAAMLGIDEVVAIGAKAEKIADGAAQSGGSVTHFATKEEAVHELTDQLGTDTAMLVKASHAMHFGWIVEQLKQAYD